MSRYGDVALGVEAALPEQFDFRRRLSPGVANEDLNEFRTTAASGFPEALSPLAPSPARPLWPSGSARQPG